MRKKIFHNLPQEDTAVEAGELNEMQKWIDEDKLDKSNKTVSDWNEETETQLLLHNTASQNGPSGVRYGEGFNLARANGSYAQFCLDTTTGKLYTRGKTNSSSEWSNWLDTSEPETITNENGTATKFADGTMICRGFVEVGASDSLPVEKDLPLSFIDTGRPYERYGTIVMSNLFATNQNVIWSGSIISASKISARQTLSTTGQRSNSLERAAYIAIGRWK